MIKTKIKIYAVYSSITYANKALAILKCHTHASLLHTPSEISTGSCSYSVVLDKSFAELVPKEHLFGIFEKTADGFIEVKTDGLS